MKLLIFHLRNIQAPSERHQNLLVVQARNARSIGAVSLPLGLVLVCWEEELCNA